MLKKIIKPVIIFSLISFFLFLLPSLLFGQERKLEIDYPEIFGLKPETLREYVRYIFNFAVLIVGLILFGSLIWAGVLYLTSAGQPSKLKEAKERITSVFLGVIILLSSGLILYTIDPQLVSFRPPIFPALKEREIPPPAPLEPEKTSLISLEIPWARAVENGLWAEERQNKIKNLIKENQAFLTEEIKVKASEERTLSRISDLNKYLERLTVDCQCSNTRALSTFPSSFGMPVDPKACVGDPCLKESREKMEKILAINQIKQKGLLEFQKKIIKTRDDFEKELRVFLDVEEQIHACDQQDRALLTLNEYLARLNHFDKLGWKSEIEKVPGTPPSGGDPSTFYCDKSGTLFKYPYPLLEEEEIEEFLPPELIEVIRPELLYEKIRYQRISCPIEFPVGEITDEARMLASSLIIKLDELAALHEKMVSKIEKMRGLISQCNEKKCTNNTLCVPNPCFKKCAPPPNPCFPFCKSPCLQAVGGCYGFCPASVLDEIEKKIENCFKRNCPLEEMEKLYQEVGKCSDACPRPEIKVVVAEIKTIDDNILQIIKEIEEILPKAASLIFDEENPRHIKNIRTGMGLCYSQNPKDPSWKLLSCNQALENYGPTGQIIDQCHPRNFFCCMLDREKELTFPWQPPPISPAQESGYILPTPKYEIPEYTGGCPPGWRCNHDVRINNQYQDLAEPLKELLACMRQRLDNFQKEKEISGPSIGRITSISDSKLYTGECKWEVGPSNPPCSHRYDVAYGNKAVSCHYGGYFKHYERKSYAIDFGARLPGDHYELVRQAAKECDPRVFTLAHGSDENFHLHVSLGAAYGAGCDPSSK